VAWIVEADSDGATPKQNSTGGKEKLGSITKQVWEALQRSYSREPYQIRRMLTERTPRASDKRAALISRGSG
jgi:hypothetical protein